jgi:hypothetical protein
MGWPLVVLTGTACLCALLLAHAIDLASRVSLLDERLEKAERTHAAVLRARVLSQPALTPAARLAEDAVRKEMSRPWARLFGAIEKASGPDISLLTMVPLGARAEVSLSGEARSMAALLAFMRQLGDGGFFTQVHLRDHHIDPDDALRPVRFSVQLKWGRP